MELGRRLILASGSPRRVSLLGQIGLLAEVIPSGIDEEMDTNSTPGENARRLAIEKARSVAKGINDGLVIGADTIVVIEGRVLGKPRDREDAVQMLLQLGGRTHTVITGFCILDRPSDEFVSEIEETKVTFRALPRAEVERYVDGGSPMDKAGSYGIQDDYGAVFVTRVEGCFYNVMGFPLAKFYQSLMAFQQRRVTSGIQP